MVKTSAGKKRHWVTLFRMPITSPDSDGFEEALSPFGVWAQIEPNAASAEERTTFSYVVIDYHPQVNVDTIIHFRTQRLYVRGVQNVAAENAELRLLCEQVEP